MQTEFYLFKLDSVGANTVGGPEAGAISLIYSYFLNLFQTAKYKQIFVNHVQNELDEFVLIQPGGKVYVNIKFPISGNFEKKKKDEKNRIRLEIVHTALLRIAVKDKKFEVDKLIAIRDKILQNNFSFTFVLKVFKNKKNNSLIAKIIIRPEIDRFDYFINIEENGKEICKVLLFQGVTTIYFFENFFNKGKWKNDKELIITGKEKQFEMHISIEKCKVDFINLTPYSKPPLFEMQKAFLSKDDKEKAYQDWLHSLPPAKAAILREANN